MLACNCLSIQRKVLDISLADYRTSKKRQNFLYIDNNNQLEIRENLWPSSIFFENPEHMNILDTTVNFCPFKVNNFVDYQRNRNTIQRRTCAVVRVHLFVRIKSFYTVKHKALDAANTKPITVLVQFRYFGFTLVKSHYNALKNKQSKYHGVE